MRFNQNEIVFNSRNSTLYEAPSVDLALPVQQRHYSAMPKETCCAADSQNAVHRRFVEKNLRLMAEAIAKSALKR